MTAKCKQGANWTSDICGFLVAGLIICSPLDEARAADRGKFVALDYEIHLNGIPVAELRVDASIGSASYALNSTLWTRGVVDLILGFKSYAQSQGRIANTPNGPAVRPSTHSDDNVWMDEERTVRIVYGPAGPDETEVSPLPADEGRDAVSAQLRTGTQDLLSAALQLSLWADSESVCQSTSEVFDGRRRYDLIFAPSEDKDVTQVADIYCVGKLDRLAGRSAEPWLPRSKTPKEFQLWLSKIDPDFPPVPYRLKAFGGIGWLVAELSAHSRDPRPKETEPEDDKNTE